MWVNQLFSYWSRQLFAPGTLLRKKYQYFRDLLTLDRYCLEKMAEIEEIHYRRRLCDYARVVRLCHELDRGVGNLVKSLIALNPLRYRALRDYHKKVSFYLDFALRTETPDTAPPFVLGLEKDLNRQPEETILGGKAMNFMRIRQMDLPTPDGFCITTRAFNAVVAANGLRPKINEILSRICLESVEDLEKKCSDLRELFLEAAIPDDVQKEIDAQVKNFSASKLAVRSSASGEDSNMSFAGQYKSLLHIRPEDIYEAYKQILASKYTPRAITYRIHEGLADELLPMAVLVLEMVDSRKSGVVYSSGIKNKDEMGVYIVTGLGDKLVSGEMKAKEVFIDKKKGVDVSSGLPRYMENLFHFALALEKSFGKPQDIEWTVDPAENLLLLQTRPLQAIVPDSEAPGLDLPVLAKGEWASSGVVSGNVFTLESKKDPSKIPKGSIVVVRGLYPELTAALGILGGVIAEEGSAASHFATIAREGSVPVIINVTDAVKTFQNGQMVTIDGNRGLVHDGKALPGMLSSGKKETWQTEKMNDILETVSSLNLTDAQSEGFVPQNCRSMHDLIRFTHEMGVREMFSMTDRKGRGLYQSKILDMNIPLVFRVLNLEKGLTKRGDERPRVAMEDVTCKPFRAMFSGLGHEKIKWDPNMKHFDWEAFDKVSAGVFSPENSPLLSSYALLAEDYMHALIRFGYHFVVVDALLCREAEQNYIQFSFKGGGAEASQKLMRLEAIRIVLEKYGFDMDMRGDLLEAEYKRKSDEETEKRLTVVGFVLGKTRLMDMRMNQEKIKKYADAFIREIDEILAV